MSKRIFASFFTLIMMLFSFLFTGCLNSDAVKTSAEVYCSLIFKSQPENIEKIGMSELDKEDFIEDYEDAIKNQLKNNLKLSGYSASNDELNCVCDAYREALSKITYEAKQISKSGKESEVEISLTHFDMRELDSQAVMAAMDETDSMEFENEYEENKKFGQIYLQKFIDQLKTVEISSEKSSSTFKFIKVNGYWVADDSANFGYKLIQLATNKENLDLDIDQERLTPEESAEVFWNLIINQDSSGLEKLGYNKVFGDRIIKMMNKNELKIFKNQLNQSTYTVSDEQVQGIVDALRSAITKNSVSFQEVSKTDNSAQIKVSSTSIKLNSILNDTLSRTKSAIISGSVTNEQQAIDLCCTNFIDTINNAQVSSSTSERTFNFTKVADIWVPSDVSNFTESISEMAMN